MMRIQAIKGESSALINPFVSQTCLRGRFRTSNLRSIDMRKDLPENERKKFAARAVREVMKNL
jgi:hypothetical protein